MRILNGVLAAVLLLFAAVQFNDLDGVFWAAVYALAALWCGLSAIRPAIYAWAPAQGLFALSALAALVGLFWFWPTTPGWWKQDVWWNTETAREGMGMMIIVVALVCAGLSMRGVRA